MCLPTTAVLELTYRCTHACVFCSCPWEAPHNIFDRRKELSTAEWKDILTVLVAKGVSSFAISGGEPTLREDLFEIMSFAAALTMQPLAHGENGHRTDSPTLFLITNGTLVDDDVLRFCHQFRIRLSVSLPGLSTYGFHTGTRSTAARVLSILVRAQEVGVETTVGVTVTKVNLSELRQTIAAALLSGADSLLLNRFLPGGRGLQYVDQLSLGLSDVRSMLVVADEVLRQADRRGKVGTEIPACITEGLALTHLEVSSRCAAGRHFFAVDPSGFIRVCNHSPVRLCSVADAASLTTDARWLTYALGEYLPSACCACSRKTVCDAGCRAAAEITTRSVCGPDPIFSGKEGG